MKTYKKNSAVKNNIYIIKLLLKTVPRRVYATIFRSFIGYFTWIFFSIIFMQYIFSSFESRTFKESSIFIMGSMVLFMILGIYIAWFDRGYKIQTDEVINYELNKLVFNKAAHVDISCYENPHFYDNYTSSITDVNEKFIGILENIANIISVSLFSIYVIYTMVKIDKFSILFIIIPVISSFVFSRLANEKRYECYVDNIVNGRKKDYVGRTILLKKYAKEIRLSNIFNVLKNTYMQGYQGSIENINKYEPAIFGYSYIRAFLSFPMAFESVWLYAAFRAIVSKAISIGDYVILASAIVNITNMLLTLVNSIINASQNGLYISKFREFMEYEPRIDEFKGGMPVKGGSHILELKDVSFKYENQDKYILHHVNMVMRSDNVITLVGLNGAGKTTLIKLIIRLYDVAEGEILLDGINIKEYDIKSYRELFGTVFQNFQILAMTVAENILMNDIQNEKEYMECKNALISSGLYDKVNVMKNTMDTNLTKEFDDEGVILSGGQAQKLAIARAYAKNSPILILDEPSSALDAIAEYELYQSLSKLCSDDTNSKLVIIISHRMSFANLADYVYLLNEGYIAEEGIHSELMEKQGMYADMYEKQSKEYINGVRSEYEK